MERGFAIALLGALTACSVPVERVALPPLEDAQALLWIVSTAEASRAFAIDVTQGFDPSEAAVSVDEAETTELHALSYQRPLSALGLAPGALAIDPAGRALPELPDARVWRRSIGPLSRSPWAPVLDWPPAIAELKFPRTSPCGTFVVERTLPLADDLDVMQAILRFGDGRTLFAASTDYHAPPTLVPLEGEALGASIGQLPVATVHAWGPDELDQAWAAVTPTTSSTIELWRIGARGQPVEVLPSPLPGDAPTALAWRDGALFMLVKSGLEHWDGTTWSRPFETSATPVEGTGASVRPTSRDEAWFMLPEGVTIGFYRRGEPVRTFPFAADSAIAQGTVYARTFAVHPELGPLVATSMGVYHRLHPWPLTADSSWVVLAVTGPSNSTGVIVPFARGLVAAGVNGFWSEFYEGYGFCPISSLPGLNVYQFVPLGGDRWLASGTAHGASVTRVIQVRWTRPT